MRMLRWISGLGFFSVFLFCSVVATTAQDSSPSGSQSALSLKEVPSPAAPTTAPKDSPASAQTSDTPPPAATLSDVMDRVVQREHYFMAQMRHMHPLVETYVQDLKNDAAGNTEPVKDQYFLGRLDMSEG